jgi:hypothetical protein
MEIFTNLNADNMFEELKTHLKNIKTKKYIKDCLELHYKYNFISKKEYLDLKKEYLESEEE